MIIKISNGEELDSEEIRTLTFESGGSPVRAFLDSGLSVVVTRGCCDKYEARALISAIYAFGKQGKVYFDVERWLKDGDDEGDVG